MSEQPNDLFGEGVTGDSRWNTQPIIIKHDGKIATGVYPLVFGEPFGRPT